VAVFWVSSGLFQQHVYFYPKPEIYWSHLIFYQTAKTLLRSPSDVPKAHPWYTAGSQLAVCTVYISQKPEHNLQPFKTRYHVAHPPSGALEHAGYNLGTANITWVGALLPSGLELQPDKSTNHGSRGVHGAALFFNNPPYSPNVVYSFACWYSLMTCRTRHAEPRSDLVPQRTTFLPVALEQLL